MSDANFNLGDFPNVRPRRLRQSQALRRLVAETTLSADQLIMPYFVKEGMGIKEEIDAMPGQFRFSLDQLLLEIEDLTKTGVSSILLFGLPSEKDAQGSEAMRPDGIVQKAVREIKNQFPDLLMITDVCLCAYTDHGHCGVVSENGEVQNDQSLSLIARIALSHAEAGADMVAPSDMMDGRVGAIRKMLDQSGFKNVPIMSYAAKYASAYYGPFREAADCAPKEEMSFPRKRESSMDPPVKPEDDKLKIPGTRETYQMDPANAKEALREMALDVKEGADILMVKPALAYLDIVKEASRIFPLPIAAYAVSGEYSMIKAAAEKGWIAEKPLVLETLTSLKRAGAGILITYHAKQVAAWLRESSSSQVVEYQ